MKIVKTFLLPALLWCAPQIVKAAAASDSTLDSTLIKEKVISIEQSFKKQKLKSIRNVSVRAEIDSSVILVDAEISSNKIGHILISRPSVNKRSRYIKFTYFNGALARIELIEMKGNLINHDKGSGIYYFSNGSLFYKTENTIEPQNVNDLVSLADHYYDKAERLIERPN